MKTERQVIEHLRSLNPVNDDAALDLPDTSYTAFLDSLETRRKPMSVETRPQTQTQVPTPKPSRRRTLALAIGAAAAVALAIVVGVAIAGSDSGSDVAAAPPLEVAEQMIEAHIAGGPVAMLQFLEPAYAELEGPDQEVWQIFNEHIVGGEYRCEQTRANRVLCRTPTTTNEFHGAAGIEPEVTWMITFNEESEVIDLQEFAIEANKIAEFNEAFASWLLATYPGLAEPGYAPTADPASAEIALQYVDEFVAQSDVYPLSASE